MLSTDMCRYFYVDTENVIADAWSASMHKLAKNDKVILFESRNSKPIPVRNATYLQETVCKLELIHCEVGTANAMDFILCTKLGEQVLKAPKSNHYIVSNDKGYDAAIAYLKSCGYAVDRIASISQYKHYES